jgi:FkbM family methyltransferase
MRFLKWLSCALHSALARGPRWLVVLYITTLSAISRAIDNPVISTRLQNSLFGPKWPLIDFGARKVTLGSNTTIFLHPHLGEPDQAALFSRRLGGPSEHGCFCWLEKCARDYETVIDVGANVGLYSLFFNALSKERDACLKEIFAFEPSREAYRRLLMNLAANAADKITAYPVAIGNICGFESFFEPEGHLTNGSFSGEFASIFSNVVQGHPVMVFDARRLESLFERSKKILLKIDVENYEPQLLQAFSGLINKYRPDIIIEVLPTVADAIEASPCLSNYKRFLITSAGLKPFLKLEASVCYRDWFLQPANRSDSGRVSSRSVQPATPAQRRHRTSRLRLG